jgi:(2Fe-2S) ferredoxin
MAKFEKHIFICTNQRDASSPRGCCNPTGQSELQKQFKEKLKARGLHRRFRANKAGCLDQCEHGPNIVIYPDAVWYGGVQIADVDEIIDSHLLGGKPVARLTLKDECINTESCEHKTRLRG